MGSSKKRATTNSSSSKKHATKGISKVSPKKQNANPPWMVIGLAALAILVMAVIYVFTQGEIRKSSAKSNDLSVAQAYEKYEQDTFFLDVRQPEEWNGYRIPGTTLIPLESLAARVNELPRDKEIVVVCRTGNRSQKGVDILEAAGFTNVYNMVGGVNQWQASGYPIFSGP